MATPKSSAPAHLSAVEVESNSRPGLFHAVTLEPESCSCEATAPVCRHIRIARIRAVKSRPHVCNNGWVSMEVESLDPDTGQETLEKVLYLCRRCLGNSR